MEASPLQPLGADPQAAAIPEQRFEPGVRAVSEQEQMAAQGVLAQVVAHQTKESIEAFAHVHGFDAEVDLGCQAESEHVGLRRLYDSNQSGQFLLAVEPAAFDAPAVGQHEGEATGLLRQGSRDVRWLGQFDFDQRR